MASDLVNIVSDDFFKIRFNKYVSAMVPVNIAAITSSLTVLMIYFHRAISVRYDLTQPKSPNDAIRGPATFRAGWIVLVLLLIGIFGLESLEVPVSLRLH